MLVLSLTLRIAGIEVPMFFLFWLRDVGFVGDPACDRDVKNIEVEKGGIHVYIYIHNFD